ncbi:MAG TPA: hypothetical protein VN457_03335, partial [Chlamydiales bacterium]|nr:hypothetical protein [Chlamydiales bacterium]
TSKHIAKMSHLHTLRCYRTPIKAAGIKALKPLQSHLQYLSLMLCPGIDDTAFNVLTSQFNALREFDISQACITDNALDCLSRLTKLDSLTLGMMRGVTIRGFKKLVQLKGSLQNLSFCYPTIDADLLLHLINNLGKLKFLRLFIMRSQAIPESVQKAAKEKGIVLDITASKGPAIVPSAQKKWMKKNPHHQNLKNKIKKKQGNSK